MYPNSEKQAPEQYSRCSAGVSSSRASSASTSVRGTGELVAEGREG